MDLIDSKQYVSDLNYNEFFVMPQNYVRAATAHNGSNGKRAPGRPRSEQSRQAILRSTLKFLRQPGGFPDLSIQAVAAAANVSKATVYRWWPTKAALVADAFSASLEQELQFPDTGSLRSDMTLQMLQAATIGERTAWNLRNIKVRIP